MTVQLRFLYVNDTPDYKYVGEPVTATDDDTGDVLTYTLDGTDKRFAST